jgi:hypothetical protein
MPFGDGTGPRGVGLMTGRGEGYCISVIRPRFTVPALSGPFGFPRRSGRGRGRGFSWGTFNPFVSYPRR